MLRPRASRRLLILLSFALLLLSAPYVSAQTETWEPATTGFATELKVWTSAGNTYAKVRLTFPTGGWRVDWGQVTRAGNTFTADAKVERWTGASTQAITYKENTYNLGALPSGTYTFTFKSYGVAIKSQQFDPSLVVEHWEPVTLTGDRVGIRIWTVAGGPTNTKVELYFPDTGYSVVDPGQVSRSGNEFSIDIKAERWTGESTARITLVDHDYELGTLQAGAYTLVIKMYGTIVRTQPFSINASPAALKLLTEDNSERAVALDSVTWLRLFPLVTPHNFSPERRARIVLFLSGVDWSSNQTAPSVIAQAEDAAHTPYPLTVEYIGKVPGFDWLTQVIVRPSDELKDGGDVWVTLTVRGQVSNKALVSLKPSSASQP
jgi:hypothetical protein